MMRRTTRKTFVALVLGLGLALPLLAAAAAPETKADHIALAEKYEKLAEEQKAVAREHAKMLKEYKANAHRYPKQMRQKWIARMNKHCRTIIRASNELAKQYDGMARWHRMAAREMDE